MIDGTLDNVIDRILNLSNENEQLRKEVADLKHDNFRYVTIASQCASEVDRLRGEVRQLRADLHAATRGAA